MIQEKKTFYLRDIETLRSCWAYLRLLQLGAAVWKVTVQLYKDPKSREQEERYHAMIGDIARARPKYYGIKVDQEDWKRILVDAFAKYKHQLGEPIGGHGGRVVPALDGAGVVQLGVQTRRFRKAEASDFIEFLHAYAAHAGIHLQPGKQHGQ